MPKNYKSADLKIENGSESVKYNTDVLLKSQMLTGYQQDFAKALLTEPEYTVAEANAILDSFFGTGGIK